MNHDQNKKTLRQFQCRDYLWEIFEQMSGELECSVDYLVNEAMRQYARSRNYGVRTPGPGTSRPPAAAPPSQPAPRPPQPSIPSAPPPPPQRGGSYPGFAAPPPAQPQGGYPPPPAPPRPAQGPAPGYGATPPQQQPQGGYPPPRAPSSYPPGPPTQRPPAYSGAPPPPPLPSPAPYVPQGGYAPAPQAAPPPLPGGPSPAGAMAILFVIFNGQKFPVNKEEFIVGRGSKTADLPIKDGNISRRHAAVIWQNGAWYMKDLGSTNGVEFQGRKIDSKRIEEGDVYQLCDYEVRFTYR
jgi:neural Wiskott-Aldrich syndrome protein